MQLTALCKAVKKALIARLINRPYNAIGQTRAALKHLARPLNQMLLVMKITVFLILVATLHVSAKGYSQEVNLSGKDAPLVKLFREIRRQTGYTFIYTETILKEARNVTIDIRGASLKQALDVCFHEQPFTYEIFDKTIVIRPVDERGQPLPPLDIRGIVTGSDGKPLAGVSVTVRGTKKGTETDAAGAFTIRGVDNLAVLVFSYIGYQHQEVVIRNGNDLKISLVPTPSALNDVVVIGYGTQRRGDVNGAISSLKAADIEDIPQPSVDQMMQGKVAGVTITQNSGTPGSATSVHVRGITSFGNSEPLYVIDGVAISGDASNSSTSGYSVQLSRPGSGLSGQTGQEETGVSPLALINPNDIESIDVLKDASATAIYGSRGANGVIIITTKRGKIGRGHLAYDGFYGLQQQGKLLDMMNLKQYSNLENVLADEFQVQRRGEFADPTLLGPGTNWQKAIFRTAPEQSHEISASGGKDGLDYFVSGSYFNQEGTVLGSNFNRYAFRTNLNAQVKDWFKVGMNLAASRSNQNVGLGSNTGIIYNALLSAPDNAVYNADGTFAGPIVNAGGLAQGTINPVAQALSITNTLLRNNVDGGVYGDLKFFRDLSLRSELNGDFNWSNAATFNPTYTWGAFTNQTASLYQYNTNSTYWDWKEYLNYNHTWNNKHNLTALAGHEVWESTWNGVTNSISNFVAGNSIQTLNLGTQSSALLNQNKGSQVMESWLARGIYTYNNKYSLTATIRDDRSSKFLSGHQTGYFPSGAVSWRLSEEPFMAGFSNIANNIKLRLGYGTTGNQNIANYLYGSSLTPVSTGLGTGFVVNNVGNPPLTWETAIQKDLGLDFSLLNNRITASFDYYDKSSKNFLFQTPLPAFLLGGIAEYFSGAAIKPPYVNAGQIRNRGFEFSINSKNITTRDFAWTTTVIFTHYNNKVLSLANGVQSLIGSVNSSFISLPVTRTVVGGPVGEFYGWRVQGIIKTADQLAYLTKNPQNVTGGTSPSQVTNNLSVSNSIWLGDLQYVDENHDGKVDANDQVPLGNPNPDFTYSITNTFSYKWIDLSIFLNGSYGGKILNALDYQIAGLSGLYQNQLASSANFWTPENPNSNIPAPRAGVANNNLVMSDRFLQSASFLRVQNVRLGFNLPASWTTRLKIDHIKIYASGQNLFVFTPYKGLDPEIGSLNQNPILMNVDMGRYPIARTITFGINASF
ncbi:MAG: TonB-dependent receptor [Puia sp.]|nr:TonB-dependent receptor [Puia sp.]